MYSYLSDKGLFSEQLYPKSVEGRARVDEFLEWQHLNVRLVCTLFFRSAWLLPAKGLAPPPKPEAVQKLIKDVEANLGLVERIWLEKDFLIGDKLTVADIFGVSEINQISRENFCFIFRQLYTKLYIFFLQSSANIM